MLQQQLLEKGLLNVAKNWKIEGIKAIVKSEYKAK
jgi:hypothetical protein